MKCHLFSLKFELNGEFLKCFRDRIVIVALNGTDSLFFYLTLFQQSSDNNNSATTRYDFLVFPSCYYTGLQVRQNLPQINTSDK